MVTSKAVYLLLAALFLLVNLMSVSVAFAAKAAKSKADVVVKGSHEVAGESKLVRTNDKISFDIKTTMLPPQHAFSVWIKVHEKKIITVGAGGFASGDDGVEGFNGALETGPIPDRDGVRIMKDGDGTFDTPLTSKITFVIRDHGPIIPEMVDEQTNTYDGGCRKGEPNKGMCKSIQQSVHKP